MALFDTFFLLFKTDAPQAAAEVAALDKKISELAAKGKARSEEENKELAGLRKQRTQATQDLKDQTKETENLGVAFTDLSASALAGVGALLGVGALKDAVGNVVDMEVALGRLEKVTGVSANEISAWDAAVQRASGGPAGEFVGWLQQINAQLIAQGRGDQVKNIIPNLLALSRSWKDASLEQKQFWGQQYGLTQDLILLLDQGPDKIKAIVDAQKEALTITNEDTAAALELSNAWENVKRSIQGTLALLTLHPWESFKKGIEALADGGDAVDWKKVNAEKPKNSALHWLDRQLGTHLVTDRDQTASATTATNQTVNSDQTASATLQPGTPSGIVLPGGNPNPSTPADALYADLDVNNPEVEKTLNRAVSQHYHHAAADAAASSIAGAQALPYASLAPPAPSSTTTVKIDKIEVHTQASDADGIAHAIDQAIDKKLSTHHQDAITNVDDGIAW